DPEHFHDHHGADDPEHFHDHHGADDHKHDHDHQSAHYHEHSHREGRHHSHEHLHEKVIDLNIDILSANNLTAAMNRRFFEGRKVLCLNLVSSPGSGKTTLLDRTIRQMTASGKLYVIEGDQQTLLDAARIEKAGAPAVQVNTGSGCHLDAGMVEAAVKKLDIETGSLLFIENVGNLVCPAMFDLGEHKRVVIVSVTEGEDKPLKYPYMFQSSHLCIINKTDLLPYVDFRTDEFIDHARTVNPQLDFMTVSAKSGEGMDLWYQWIADQSDALLSQ
ncbi:MAG: hydrogenase nickel incorporation protein HypB, partial [Candidatus Atribacteria bacterium]